jgi:RimJ/RimL family protein N-acetyltransferase
MHSRSSAELLDGDVITVRRLRPSDADNVVGLYEELTDDERYFRFFTKLPAHLRTRALLLTAHSHTQYAIGAFDSEKLLGVANYIESNNPEEAEVAVVVAHDQHMRGVGTVLLHRLAKIAKQHGIRHLVAEVLAENHPMLRVLTDAGWPVKRRLDGSVLEIHVDLDAPSPADALPNNR